MFQKQLRYPEDSKWYTRLFIPTGAYTGECYTSGALATPPQHDLKVIQNWIECANRLLPDDEARERAGFKLEDLQFTVRSVRGVTRPPYYSKAEREVRGNVFPASPMSSLTDDLCCRSSSLPVTCRRF